MTYFRNKSILIGLLIIFSICLIIWFAGPFLKIHDELPLASIKSRLIYITLVALILSIGGLLLFIVSKNADSKLIAHLLKKPQKKPDTGKKDKQEIKIYKAIKKQFYNALKNAAYQSGKSKWLYEMPWYVVVGAPSAGKTSLILNSNPIFPLVRNLDKLESDVAEEDQNYGWWITEDAVFLNSSIDNQLDNTAIQTNWSNVIKLLKKYKGKKAINGVILVVSLPDLMNASDEEQQALAVACSQRSAQLSDEFNIKIPVHVFFTKCDNIAGFAETFQDLANEYKNQPFGFTLPINPFAKTELSSLITHRFNYLITQLKQHVFMRGEQEKSFACRKLLYFFPSQIALIKETITSFFYNLVDSQFAAESLKLRGAYFCSSHQYGPAYNFLAQKVASQFEFNFSKLASSVEGSKSFFVKETFENNIFPEANWLFYSKKFIEHSKWYYKLSCLIIALFLLIGISILVSDYLRSEAIIENTPIYLENYEQKLPKININSNNNNNPIIYLAALNELSQAKDMCSKSQEKWRSYFQFMQGEAKVCQLVYQMFDNTLTKAFVPYIPHQIEVLLQKYQGNPLLLMQTLQSYLALNDHKNTQSIKTTLTYDWKINAKIPPESLSLLNNYLDFFLKNLLPTFTLDQNLINQVKQQLLNINFANNIYELISHEAAVNNSNLIAQWPESFNQVFNMANKIQTIPGLYTADGYINLYLKSSAKIVPTIANSIWFSGLGHRYLSLQELEAYLASTVNMIYTQDYINYWQNFLNSFQILQFNNLSQAVNALRILADGFSPLQVILKLVYDNTANMKTLPAIPQQFANLNSLSINSDPKKPSQISTINSSFSKPYVYLATISQSPNPEQAEFQATQSLFNIKTPNPMSALIEEANTVPLPIKTWLYAIVNNVWQVLLNDTSHYINKAWQTIVMTQYNRNLSCCYPINKKAAQEINLRNLNDFFGPAGILDNFFQNYLKSFVDVTQQPIKYLTAYGFTLTAAQTTLTEYSKLQNISSLFFPKNAKTPTIIFTIEPLLLDANSTKVTMQLGVTNITYQHGPQSSTTFAWPMADSSQQITLSFSDFQGNTTRAVFSGVWAWFRLLNSATKYDVKDSDHIMFTFSQNGHSASFIISAASIEQLINF